MPHATNIIVSKLDGAVDVIFFRMIQNRFCTLDVAIMIKFVLSGLQELGFTKEQVYTTLELRMKCGIGKCGPRTAERRRDAD